MVLAVINHASGLTTAAEIRPIEFWNQRVVPIRSLAFDQLTGDHILSLDPCINPHLIEHVNCGMNYKGISLKIPFPSTSLSQGSWRRSPSTPP